ncbi:MAG: methyltransferase domain-containing protein [Cyanobacteriota bacterium]
MTSGGLDRRTAFGRAAATYAARARLQQALAWRLAHHCRGLALPAGPVLDLGAGPGTLAGALQRQRPDLDPWLVDDCAPLLALAPAPAERRLLWDLDRGLPPQARGAALLMSSFALHWLADPVAQLRHWLGCLAPGGWLALAVPVAGSFDGWRQAARRAGVACTALALPDGDALRNAVEATVRPSLDHRLRFTVGYPSPLAFLRELRQLGVQGQAAGRLQAGAMRRLLRHWPADARGRTLLTWELRLLLAQRP